MDSKFIRRIARKHRALLPKIKDSREEFEAWVDEEGNPRHRKTRKYFKRVMNYREALDFIHTKYTTDLPSDLTHAIQGREETLSKKKRTAGNMLYRKVRHISGVSQRLTFRKATNSDNVRVS